MPTKSTHDEMTQILLGELERIRERDGLLTSAAVVEAARSDASPLHPRFEWDDTVAAHEHRLHQARGLIRTFEAEVVLPSGKVSLPVYSNVKIADPAGRVVQGYARTQDILLDPARKESLLRSVRAQARRLGDLAKNLEEASELRGAIDKFLGDGAPGATT